MGRPLDLNDIRLLMQVVEHGSYTAASHAIGVPKSTISQRIAALERAVGTGLLRRTSRSFSLTEAGTALLPHARAIEDVARRVEAALLERSGELLGTLRLSCSHTLAQVALSPLVPVFLARHGAASVRLETTNRFVDLVADGFDMAIRLHVGPLRDSTLRQRVVARARWMLVASPGWLSSRPLAGDPSGIQAEEALCFSASNQLVGWTLFRGDEQRVVSVAPRLISDDMATLQAAAVAGGGVTCLPAYVLDTALRSGQLLPVFPDWRPPESTVSVVTPPRAQSSRLAATFSDFLAAELARAMRGPDDSSSG